MEDAQKPWSQLLREYSQDTSVHGVRYLGLAISPWARKLLWLLIVLAAFVGFTYIVTTQVIYYLKWPRGVNIEVVMDNQLAFPVMTLCNQNLVRKTKAHEANLYDHLFKSFTESATRESQECDTFKLYPNVRVGRPDQVYTEFVGVSVEVCKELCLSESDLKCASILYDYSGKRCLLTPLNAASRGMVLTHEREVDYYERIWCAGSSSIECSFEAGLCGFTVNSTSGAIWQRTRGSTTIPLTGPQGDHSTGLGYYLLADVEFGSRALLVSPAIIPGSATLCMEFMYHMYGNDVPMLNVLVEDEEGVRFTTWSRVGNHGDKWLRGFLKLGSANFLVTFEAHGGRGLRRQIAIDDIIIAECENFELECLRAETGEGYKGHEHVTASGSVCESWSHVATHVALNAFHFPDVDLKTAANFCRNPNSVRERPWCYTDVTRGQWEYCNIESCPCNDKSLECGNGKCVFMGNICDGIDDCGNNRDEMDEQCERSISCSFEDTYMCGYVKNLVGSAGEYLWSLGQGATDTEGTGPLTDHTTASTSGHYVYVDATEGTSSVRSQLRSPYEAVSDVMCLTFYVHMFGPDIGALFIYVEDSADQMHSLYDVYGNQGDIWQRHVMNVEKRNWNLLGRIRFVFEAQRGPGFIGDIAVDDIEITEGLCSRQTTCADGDITCRNGRCVDVGLVCNGLNDCGDFTDEHDLCESLTCGFDEASLCGYRIEGDCNTFTWSPQYGQGNVTVSDNQREYPSDQGSYIKAAAGVSPPGCITTLLSPWTTVEESSCISFIYYHNTRGAALTRIYVEHMDGSSRDVYGLGSDHFDIWHRRYFTVSRSGAKFRVGFQAYSGAFGRNVSIDDIKIESGECELPYQNVSCTFDDPYMCGWLTHIYGSEVIWAYRTGDDIQNRTTDVPDLYNSHGLLALDPSPQASFPDTAGYVFSPWFVASDGDCVGLSYYTFLASMNTFSVFIESESGQLHQLYNATLAYDKDWTDVRLQLPQGHWRLMLLGVRSTMRGGFIALNHIQVSNDECPDVCNNTDFRCLNGECVNPSRLCDGVPDCGDYSDEKDCDQSCLRSPLGREYTGEENMARNGKVCKRWSEVSLQMYGRGQPWLFLDGSIVETENFCRNPDGRPGGPWCYTGDNAWDTEWDYCDVTRCECSVSQYQCANGYCVGMGVLCDSFDDCGDRSDELAAECGASISCNFDDSYICGYESFPSVSGFTFLRHRQSTLTSITGPNDDHTRGDGTGYYLFSESSNLYDGDLASVRSPLQVLEDPHCLSFWYSLYGIDIRFLKVYLVTAVGAREWGHLEWDQGTRSWFEMTLQIPPGSFQIAFEVQRGWKAYSDYGIDDVLLQNGSCVNSHPCSGSQVTCRNGACVDSGSLCDGRDDCQNAWDEIEACDHSCKRSAMGEYYKGNLSVTSIGMDCLAWSSVLSEEDWLMKFPDSSLEELADFCRNPDRKPLGPWCYVHLNGDWEYCNVQLCPDASQCDAINELACSNGACVPREVECDGFDDCGDNSDESIPCNGLRNLPPYNECYDSLTGAEYTGELNVTQNGEGCTSWGSVNTSNMSPELNEYLRQVGNLSVLQNFCRNPGGFQDRPWCFTQANQTWQYCDVPICDCVMTEDGNSYIGHRNTTDTGLPCQRWDSQIPNAHSENTTDLFYDGKIDHNFCRNPNESHSAPFCYTDTPHQRRGSCNIPLCYDYFVSVEKPDCRMTNIGREYRGIYNVSRSGYPCRRWDEAAPHTEFLDGSASEAHNYCRIPVSDISAEYGLYCYVDHPYLSTEPCDVPLCPGSMGHAEVSCGFDFVYSCGYTHSTYGGHHWKRMGSPVSKFMSEFLNVLLSGSDQCYQRETDGEDYMGNVTVSANGFLCQRWDSFYPVAHSYLIFPDGGPSSAGNRCRNPGRSSPRPWCFPSVTMQSAVRLQCDIPACIDSVMVAVPGDVEGDIADLISPELTFEAPTDLCLTFWYLMFRSGGGELRVSLRYADGTTNILWLSFDDQATEWRHIDIQLKDVLGKVRFIFTSQQGTSDVPVALDDIIIKEETCELQYDCSSDEFVCDNGYCVSSEWRCDGNNDCLDSSDERNCGCNTVEFMCGNGECIPVGLVLDNIKHCPDGADENLTPAEAASLPSSYDSSPVLTNNSNDMIRRELEPLLTPDNEHPLVENMTGDGFVALIKDAGHSAADLIFSCKWRNSTCSAEDFELTMTDFGVCYTFTVDEPGVDLMTDETGAGSALRLVVNIEDYEYMAGPYNQAGIKLYMHEPNVLPLVKDLGHVLAPGLHYLIDIQVTETYRLGPPWGDCTADSLLYFDFYELATCERECEINASLSICGCLAPYMEEAHELNASLKFCDYHKYFHCFIGQQDSIYDLSRQCECREECTSASFSSALTFAAITEEFVQMIADEGGTQMSQNLNFALETNDRTSSAFITDVNSIKMALEGLKGIEANVLKLINYSETGGMDTSFLSVTENVLYSYISFLSSDYSEMFDMIQFHYQVTSSQTMSLKYLYLKQKRVLKESAMFVLQYMAQMGVPLQEALNRNNIDLNSLIKSYNETLVALYRYTVNIETRNIADPGAEDIPLTMYSSMEYKQQCYDAIESTLRSMERANAALEETSSARLLYHDVVAMTSLDDDCFGDYFTIVNNVINKMLLVSVNPYQKQIDEVLNRFKSLNVRGTLATIIQLQLDLKYIVIRYVHSDIGKLDAAVELVALADDMLHVIENIAPKASSGILEPIHSLVEEIQSSLINDYRVFFDSIMEVKPFYDVSRLYRLASNLRIWYRPIINVAGALVTIGTTQSSKDVYQSVSQDAVLPPNAGNITERYIEAAFEQPFRIISATEKYLEILQGNMVRTVFGIVERSRTYIKQTEINEEFVKSNFISIDVFFSRIQFTWIEQIQAYPFGALMGDIGGYMGLLLGGTVITVFEFLDFFIYNAIIKVTARRRRKPNDIPTAENLANNENGAYTLDSTFGYTNKAMFSERL